MSFTAGSRIWKGPCRFVALVSAALLLACDRPDPTRPEPLPSPVAQVTPLPVPSTSVVASGHQDPNVPGNTVDNNLTTRWSAPGDGQWIQYDLGATKAIGRVDIAWYQQAPNTWESVFDIQVSSDGATWTGVFSGRSRAGIVEPQGYGFPTVTCRYVRIVGHGQWDGATLDSWWNSITEVDIYTVLPVSSVVASGHDGNVPQNTLDNNLGTRWSHEGDGRWIQYDLGAARAIGGVDIAWYQQLPNTWESAFDIEVSSDAGTWTRVFSGRSRAGNLQYQRYEFATVTCRYVRIVGHGQWDGATLDSWWNSITEVDIHPGSGAGTCPAPATGPQPGTIIFQDGFESGSLSAWTQDPQTGRYSIETNLARVKSGTRSLRTLYTPTNTYGLITRWFMPGYDEVYFKFDMMFEEAFEHSMHFLTICGNNINNSKSCWGRAGSPPNGADYFYAGVDPVEQSNYRNLGPFSFYTYWPDMSCCYGNRFYQTPPQTPVVGGQWQEIVYHIKMNTPGQYNGSQTMWVNGVKKLEKLNMRWRTTTDLKINEIRFDNWMNTGDAPKTEYVWVDNVTVWRP
jgi:F5/8 type C domain-containing protein/polysaccharide lyase-like protein